MPPPDVNDFIMIGALGRLPRARRMSLQRRHFFRVCEITTAVFSVLAASAADFHPPGEGRYAIITASGTILPGGRILRPLGTKIPTGPGPVGVAVNRNGVVATADGGPERSGITVIEPPSGKKPWRERHIWADLPRNEASGAADPNWTTVAGGIAFDDSGKNIWISEGASGRLRSIDWITGASRRTISVNSPELPDSFTGGLAFDDVHRLIFVLDRNNGRLDVVDVKSGRMVASADVGEKPSAISLAPDHVTAWIATTDSVCAVDLHDAMKPKLSGCARTDSLAQVLATADRVFVSNSRTDSITVLDPKDRSVLAKIPLRIPSLEQYRGIQPAGMAYDPVTRWLLVAESGINAVGIVDTRKNALIGHLAAGWAPNRVAISGDRVYVTSALGRGTGPTDSHVILDFGEISSLYHGMVTAFPMPDASELLADNGAVFANNGFVPWMRDRPKPPDAIQCVVLIEKKGHAFDEVLGDVAEAGNGKVQSLPRLARFGMHGYADGGKTRFSVQDAPVTPNQHRIAEEWAFSDNYYIDEGSEDSAERADLWRVLDSAGVKFRKFDDTSAGFIAAMNADYGKSGRNPPPLLHLDLRDDTSVEFPYEASVVEDGDLGIGRILEYLSHSPWWPRMAVFIADDDTYDGSDQAGSDHVDSHRTMLLAAGPYIKRNYVSHTNSNLPGLTRTILELLHLPPMNLNDATAAGLGDLFTDKPDLTPFTAIAPDVRIFDPSAKASPP